MVDKSARVKPPKTEFGRRLEQIGLRCGYPTRSAFMQALGERPQQFNNWDKRQSVGEARDRLRTRTGASMDWLETGEGEMFPKGPVLAHQPSLADTDPGYAIGQLQNDIAAMRHMIASVCLAITSKRPDEGELVVEYLRRAERKFLETQGSVVLLIESIEKTARAAKERQAAAAAEAPSPSPRTRR